MKRIFIDQMERRVSLSSFPPQRIVSLVPSQTELLFYLGLEREIAGITKFCIHPEDQFRFKPKLGGTKSLHLDQIAALKPDLVIANKEENEKEQIEWLEERFPVWISDVVKPDDALEMIRRIGELTGKAEAATVLSLKVQGEFSRLRAEKWPAKRAAYLIWNQPVMAAGANTFIDSMLRLAGFKNVFSRHPRYPEITDAELQSANPELILLSSEPFPFSEKHMAHFREICPESVIRLVNGEMFSWYGSRLLEAVRYIRALRKEV